MTIGAGDLDNYMIEYIPLEVQNRIAAEYRKKVLGPKERLKKREQAIFEKIKGI